jgi:peptide/nickel transport system ATP-binding protein
MWKCAKSTVIVLIVVSLQKKSCGRLTKMTEEKKVCLSGTGLTKIFGLGQQKTVAVDHVDFSFYEGEVISIVGESGSGKTTLAKMLLGLINPTEGEIYFQGKIRDISSAKKRKEYWKNIQAIFQDPFSSYNIFNKIDTVLLDCIRMRGGGRLPHEKKVEMMTEACSFVNLKFEELTNKYPFELSGGQQQRLMIARIFLLKPKILLADEPTSMIDACSRATILDMLMQLRDEVGMTPIFITHDIGLAYYVSDTVYIMEHGKFVESGSADDVILDPKEPYTKRLISDVPKIYEEWDLSTVYEHRST